jgi:hypothetical protein
MAVALAWFLAAPFVVALEPGGRRSVLLEVRLSKALSSATAKDGDPFEGVVVKDAVVMGATEVSAGTPVKGTVLYAKRGGVMKTVGILTLQLTSVGPTSVESSRYHISADPERPTGTADVVLTRDTVLKFSVKAAQAGTRRGR